MNFIHHDHYGNFFIEVDGVKGDPALYDSPATVETPSGIYIAISPYYEGTLESDTIYKVERRKTMVLPGSAETLCNHFRPQEPCPHHLPEEEVERGA
ncbi:hypothetical protein LCGC14_0811130 [marine sediment metagenome]|uniref:Uncharacterized protein n=1 Tax=marine sediment metagenome TaxID=412755 RepID=A0A0F9Q6X4_9ZZZZ